MPNLQDLLNPDFVSRLVHQQQQHPQQQTPPTNAYGVPIVYTQPDVVLRGRLDVEVTFKHADIQGKDADHLRDLAYAVIMGNRGPGYPEVKPGLFQIWQEVAHLAPAQTEATPVPVPVQQGFDESESQRIIGQWLASLGRTTTHQDGVPGTGPTSDPGDVRNPVPGVPDDLEQSGGRSPGFPLIRDVDYGPESSATGRQRDAGESVGFEPAGTSGTRRSRRQATDEPRVPEAELGVFSTIDHD